MSGLNSGELGIRVLDRLEAVVAGGLNADDVIEVAAAAVGG